MGAESIPSHVFIVNAFCILLNLLQLTTSRFRNKIMVRIIKKRAYLLAGLAVSALFGAVSTYVRSHYSKADSWLVPPAQADVQPYTWESGGCGDGCGGCSGDASSDSCSGGGS